MVWPELLTEVFDSTSKRQKPEEFIHDLGFLEQGVMNEKNNYYSPA